MLYYNGKKVCFLCVYLKSYLSTNNKCEKIFRFWKFPPEIKKSFLSLKFHFPKHKKFFELRKFPPEFFILRARKFRFPKYKKSLF